MPRWQLRNLLKGRARRQSDPKGEYLIEPLKVQFARYICSCKYRLNLRSEKEFIACCGIEKRAHSQAIARNEQLLLRGIPDCESPLPVELLNAVLSFFLIKMKNDLGVGAGGKIVALLD